MFRCGFVLIFGLSVVRAEPDYVDPVRCRQCHQEIYDRYSRTAMGRSLYRAEALTQPEPAASLFHALSRRRYVVYRKDGVMFIRRELAAGADAIEKRVDYVVGSGNHSRSLLHRAPNGKLLELPVSWYAEGGGYWAMSPGYDRPDHSDLRREVPDSCLFCHNGYPREGRLAEGIDCQRCHGPGEAHATRGGPIVNPAQLDPESPLAHLNLGVCLQALGDGEGAKAAYRAALRLQPDLERARVYLRSLR